MEPDSANAPKHSAARQIDLREAGRLLAELCQSEQASAEAGEIGELPSIPGYEIERPIGGGGSGDVYRAFRVGSDRPVALKLMSAPHGGVSQDARVWREVTLLRELHLPCLPRLLDFGISGRHVYTVTEFVEGLPLDRSATERGLSTRHRVELLACVADAVHSLHEHGVLHRDLKPSNIIVDRQGQPVLIDLGIATMIDRDQWGGGGGGSATLMEEGRPIGTPAFMAPEQARGERSKISTRSDVYGLGASGYVLLVGQPPHDTETSIHEAIRRVAHDEPVDPRRLAPELPHALGAVLMKAVARDPRSRYSSAAAFAEDLRRWLHGEAVEAQPPTAWQRAFRWVGRRPVLASTVASLAIAGGILGGTRLSVWWWYRRPGAIVLVNDGREAQLRSRAGAVLRSWRMMESATLSPISLARLLDRPTELGGGRVVATMLMYSQEVESSGRLCVWDADGDLRNPLWSAPGNTEPLVPPRPPQPEDDTYRTTFAVAEDVFDDADHPGLEIIATFTQNASPAALRIYDLSGHVLFELWHRGTLSPPLWHPASRQLILAGLDNRFKALGAFSPGTGFDVKYPLFVAAVRPVPGLRLPIVNQEDLAEPQLEWYRYVTSRDGDASPPVGVRLDRRPGADSKPALFFLGFQLHDGSASGWTLNAAGQIVYAAAADGFVLAEAQRGAERMNDYQLVDELPEGLFTRTPMDGELTDVGSATNSGLGDQNESGPRGDRQSRP